MNISGEKNVCESFAAHFAKNHTLAVNQRSRYDQVVADFINRLRSEIYVSFSDTYPALPSIDIENDDSLLVALNRVLEIINSRKNGSAVGTDGVPK